MLTEFRFKTVSDILEPETAVEFTSLTKKLFADIAGLQCKIKCSTPDASIEQLPVFTLICHSFAAQMCGMLRRGGRRTFLKFIQNDPIVDHTVQSVCLEGTAALLFESLDGTQQIEVNADVASAWSSFSEEDWKRIERSVAEIIERDRNASERLCMLVLTRLIEQFSHAIAVIGVRLNRYLTTFIDLESSEAEVDLQDCEILVGQYDKAQAETRFEVQARFSDVLVTSAKRWPAVYAQMQEHFSPHQYPLDSSEPPHWERIANSSNYVLLVPITQPPGQGEQYARHLFYRISSLAELLLEQPSADDLASQGLAVGQFRVVSEVSNEATCMLDILPNKQPDLREIGIISSKPKDPSPFTAFPPFRSQSDIVTFEREGYSGLYELLYDSCDYDLNLLTHAIDAFAAAKVIARTRASLPSDLAEGWAIAALAVTIESTFCDPSYYPVDGQPARATVARRAVRDFLRSRGVKSESVKLIRDAVDLAFEHRNIVAHQGKAKLKWGDFASIVRAIEMLLAECLKARR